MRNVRQRQRRPTLEALRRARVDAGLTISELAKRAGVSRDTISHAERGRHSLQGPTLSKIAHALGRVPSELLAEEERLAPKAERHSSPEPSFEDVLDDERRSAWEAAVEDARRLRETGRAQMWKALSEWRASKQRGEPYAIRDKHLVEMGVLLKEAYDANVAVGGAYMQAALKQSSDAPLPAYLREESGAATDFYIDLWRLVQDAGLSIRTSSKQAGEQAGEQADPEKRPTGIVDDAA